MEAAWTVTTGWWRGETETTVRVYYRLHTRTGLVGVLYRERATGTWYLAQVLD